MSLRASLAAAGAVGALVRWSGRGGGTSLPGKVLTRLEPQAIARLAARLEHGNVVVSATNGKTTTAAMVASILRASSFRLVHNRSGANMAGGVASALAGCARGGGRTVAADLGVFEVDEQWLTTLVGQLDPRAMLLGNLFRDQLDRHGELDSIAERWAKLAVDRAGRTRLVVCADDPLVAGIGQDVPDTLYFGIEDPNVASTGLQHASDSKRCRTCGNAYIYEATYLGHLGSWRCPVCSATRPAAHVRATDVELRGVRTAAFTLGSNVRDGGIAGHVAGDGQGDDLWRHERVHLQLPGLYNVYNALGAAALCLTLGVSLRHVIEGLESVEPAFGRAERFDMAGQPLSVLLVKNPAGANEVLRTLAMEDGDLDVLGALNDGIADGRDVSWVWDVDWEVLAPRVRHMTCAGTRAADLALRMKHAGVPPERLQIVPDTGAALDAAVAASNGRGPLYALPTYTAMLKLHELLASRGYTEAYWHE